LGKWIISLSRKGYNIQGIDSNKFALEKLKDYLPKAKVKLADVEKLPFEDEFFDAYLSLGVVEHFKEGPQRALSQAYRVLKKGGIAFVEVPFDSPLRRITRLFDGVKVAIKTPARLLLELMGVRKKREKVKMRFYEYRYTEKELKLFMQEAGFKDINIFPKDDISDKKSIALWLDYPGLQKPGGKMFELNKKAILLKKLLNTISPLSFSALIVAVARKE
jgi:ubiquinone/menaquinone biosynthesis C-methylase UbiE